MSAIFNTFPPARSWSLFLLLRCITAWVVFLAHWWSIRLNRGKRHAQAPNRSRRLMTHASPPNHPAAAVAACSISSLLQAVVARRWAMARGRKQLTPSPSAPNFSCWLAIVTDVRFFHRWIPTSEQAGYRICSFQTNETERFVLWLLAHAQLEHVHIKKHDVGIRELDGILLRNAMQPVHWSQYTYQTSSFKP